MTEKQKLLATAIVTAMIVAWLVTSIGCSSVQTTGGKPMYGPHDQVEM
jgi:hypothetical protein